VGCGSRDAADSRVPLAGRDCDVGVPAVLTDSGVGALRIDAPVAQLALACDILDDTTMERGREGMPERRLTAILGSIATASTIANDRVWRIEIDSPRFRTRDSLGVGTTAGALRRRGAKIVAGGIATYAIVDGHCGLSFQLPAGPAGASAIPDSARVTRVLVTGC
jgi:hypothetical protein